MSNASGSFRVGSSSLKYAPIFSCSRNGAGAGVGLLTSCFAGGRLPGQRRRARDLERVCQEMTRKPLSLKIIRVSAWGSRFCGPALVFSGFYRWAGGRGVPQIGRLADPGAARLPVIGWRPLQSGDEPKQRVLCPAISCHKYVAGNSSPQRLKPPYNLRRYGTAESRALSKTTAEFIPRTCGTPYQEISSTWRYGCT